ncbi:hypothetical protein K469DRAFT_743420 [Zopfia rhizophila CBS 207.26]|uniref:F-box domain-containing protein n=1 Tax=Zopfia rhizophila CBS 207.26 TaxID=1314779 RepID=A0A6A6D6Z3_9PEZI|nr:hypothetical protein K469DRAFT_743420 [Zopfia rhizophila CBS 207.26]
MGSYDCYCAICGGPLYTVPGIGDKSEKALAKRRRLIEKAKRRRAGEEVPKSDDEAEKSDRATSDAAMADAENETQTQEEDGDEDDWMEEHSYDPEVISEDELVWLEDCRCLGFNADAPGISKAFISGRGSYDNHGDFLVRESGDDPNDPETGNYSCYQSLNANDTPVFPFHEACHKVLARSLTGHDDVEKIDNDILYHVMAQHTSESGTVLNLDYGEIKGLDQCWECILGEEHTVRNPAPDPHVLHILQEKMPLRKFSRLPTKLDLAHRVRQDLFEKLPIDILHLIFPYLAPKQILTLMHVSWHIFSSTCNNSFWKQMIRREILPWFWETEPLILQESLDDLDCKGLYLWLDKITTSTRWMNGPFMGVANRRRVWAVCENLRTFYLKQLAEDAGSRIDDDEDAQEIMTESSSLQMPLILYPNLKVARTISKQWIRSWGEIDDKPAVLEAFWNSEGSLVRLGVIFGSDRRVFGQEDSTKVKTTKTSALIPAREWIKEIILHISEVDAFKYSRGESKASAKALTLTLTSGKSLEVLAPTPGLNQRALVVSDGLHLVGLIGQIGKEGVISRLGLLQCAYPCEEPEESPDLPQTQRLLWNAGAAKLASRGPMHSQTAPIWNHPHIRMVPFDPPANYDDLPTDILPHHVLLWAKDISELKRMARISAFVVEDGMTTTSDGKGGSRSRPFHSVLGMQVEYERRYWEPPRTIGSGHLPTPECEIDYPRLDKMEWADEHMMHFDIDGPGGEIVTEIHVAHEAIAFKLRTNRGRESHFGGPEWPDFDVLRAEEGEILVGLVVCFGTHGELSAETESYSYWKPTTITGLVMSEIEEQAK